VANYTKPHLGSVYGYAYAGPGPDWMNVILIDIDGGVGTFTEADGPRGTIRKSLNSEKLRLCDPVGWRHCINFEKDPDLKTLMEQAYEKTFDSQFYQKRRRRLERESG
jgi:hypothetical protein